MNINREALESAASKIGHQFIITHSINVYVEFKRLPKTCVPNRNVEEFEDYCEMKDTLSKSFPTNVAARKNGGQLLMYPSAAVNQVLPPTRPSIDVHLEFNSQIPWYFDLGNGQKVKPDQFDLQRI